MRGSNPSSPTQLERPSTAPSGRSTASNWTSQGPSELSGQATAPPNDSWRPVVLSLDGGGIRDLSSLYIIREIMKEIAKREADSISSSAGQSSTVGSTDIAGDEQQRRQDDPTSSVESDSGSDGKLPLPHRYFDFMVGTSTGGYAGRIKTHEMLSWLILSLIAIMLGRLHMDIDDCIREYLVFGNSIFRPHRAKPWRYFSKRFQYSPEKFTKAVEAVVSKYCGCDREDRSVCQSRENHLLRQHDFKEKHRDRSDANDDPRVNSSCRAAVVTMREGGGNSDGRRGADVTYLFRTYDHGVRGGHFRRELNPRILDDNSTLTIVEACRATSAAPTWFPHVELRGRKFIDGGVTDHNNPASLAWNEANEMAHLPGERPDPKTKGPCVLLSIGTGKAQPPRKVGLYNLLLSARHKLTDTEGTHENIERLMPNVECKYWRFNVPESSPVDGIKGLDTVKLDACKKERKGSRFWGRSQPVRRNDAESFTDAPTEETKGGYKPDKYYYRTYEQIRDRTMRYRKTNNISLNIGECAGELLKLRQEKLQREMCPSV